ncbi:MAG: hypothetical protein AAB680_05075 [Pseudomonadota bacterium]
MRRYQVRPHTTWDEVWRRAKQPQRLLPITMFFVLWALLGFNPWVGFGLAFPVMGILGLRGKRKIHEDDILIEELMEPQQPQTSIPEVAQNEAPIAPLHQQVIDDAKGAFTQIRAASNTASGDLGNHLRNMVINAEKVERGLLSDPSKLSQVQRLFTYYLPSCADLLQARGRAVSANDVVRVNEIDGMISRLDAAFADFALRIHGQDGRSVDIDLKLLEQSLAQDLAFSPIGSKSKDKV